MIAVFAPQSRKAFCIENKTLICLNTILHVYYSRVGRRKIVFLVCYCVEVIRMDHFAVITAVTEHR